MSQTAKPLVDARGVSKWYQVPSRGASGRAYLKAVDGVTLNIYRGQTFALVGESGSGKTTLGHVVVRLTEATSGTVTFDGVDVLGARRAALSRLRHRMQIVFQDPYSSLDPHMTVGQIVSEAMDGLGANRKSRLERLRESLERVGLRRDQADDYPHELSGGQRQRVAIARALAVGAEFLVLDEPASALDVSIQGQIINLLKDLQRDLRLTYLLITHDLAVVRNIAHRVGVMYLGRLVEEGSVEEIFERPLHPYTQALLSAVPSLPRPGGAKPDRIILKGEIPSAINPPAHCRFASRCYRPIDRCLREDPALEDCVRGSHAAACFNPVN